MAQKRAEQMRITSGIGADASELRKLMAEHPDYPIKRVHYLAPMY